MLSVVVSGRPVRFADLPSLAVREQWTAGEMVGAAVAHAAVHERARSGEDGGHRVTVGEHPADVGTRRRKARFYDPSAKPGEPCVEFSQVRIVELLRVFVHSAFSREMAVDADLMAQAVQPPERFRAVLCHL